MNALKIKSIKLIGKADVYNMEVEKHHNFCVNGGLIVHNCYDAVGYGLIAYHVEKSKAPKREDTLFEQYRRQIAKNMRRL